MSGRPTAAERVRVPESVLSRSDLRELGWERRAIDAIFGRVPVVVVPGYSRPVIRTQDYLDLLGESSYCDRCGQVRP